LARLKSVEVLLLPPPRDLALDALALQLDAQLLELLLVLRLGLGKLLLVAFGFLALGLGVVLLDLAPPFRDLFF